MAAIQVTSANANKLGTGRAVVRAPWYNYALLSNTNPSVSYASEYTMLSSTRIVVRSSTTLQAYDFNGSTWSTVGNSFTLPSAYGITGPMSSSRICFGYRQSQSETPLWISAYDFDGTNWSLVGTAYNFATDNTISSVAPLNSTDVAIYWNQGSYYELATFRFSGSTWSKIGNTLESSIPNIYGQHCKLTSTSIIGFRSVSGSVTAVPYFFDGTNWTIGTESSTLYSSSNQPTSVYISDNHVVMCPYGSGEFIRIHGGTNSTYGVTKSETVTITSGNYQPAMTNTAPTNGRIMFGLYSQLSNNFRIYELTNIEYIPYVISENTTNGRISCFADYLAGTFTELDSGSSIYSSGRYGNPSCAVDSIGNIHIVYGDDNGNSPSIRYVVFNTFSGVFTGDVAVIADLGADETTVANIHCSIAIDANDIPHIAYVCYIANMGTDYWTIHYNNRVGGAWNAAGIEVEGKTAQKQCRYPQITIGLDNVPVISYINESDNDVGTARGVNATPIPVNDPTAFELYDVDADNETTSGTNTSSIAVDSLGNHYVSYRDESDTYIYIIKHQVADAWTTWQSRVTNSKNGINPSLVCDGTDIYVFYEEDTDHDIVYNKYSGTWGSGTWKGETLLEQGTYNTVKGKWSSWVNFSSSGVNIGSFGGLPASSSSEQLYGATGGGEKFGQKVIVDKTGTVASIVFGISKGGSPSDNILLKVYSDSFDGSSLLATSDTIAGSSITGSALRVIRFNFSTPFSVTSGNSYYIQLERSGTRDISNYYNVYEAASSYSELGYRRDSGSWSALSNDMYLRIIITNTLPEIDYIFVDEVTSSTDVWYNQVVLAVFHNVSCSQAGSGASTQDALRTRLADNVGAGTATISTNALRTRLADKTETGSAASVQSISLLQAVSKVETATASASSSAVIVTAASKTETTTASDTKDAQRTTYSAIIEALTALHSDTTIRTRLADKTETATATSQESGAGFMPGSISETTSALSSSSATIITASAKVEPVSAIESEDALRTRVASLTETTSATHTDTVVRTRIADITETGSTQDNVSAINQAVASITEQASANATSDCIVAVLTGIVEDTDATDTQNAVRTLPVIKTETASAQDSTDAVSIIPSSKTETASATDSNSAVLIAPVSISEQGNAQDTSEGIPQSLNIMSEDTDATASSDATALRPVSILEEGSARGLNAAVSILGSARTETANAQDSVDAIKTAPATIQETTSILVIADATVIRNASIIETLSVTDLENAARIRLASVSESSGASDTESTVCIIPISIVEETLAEDLSDFTDAVIVPADIEEGSSAVEQTDAVRICYAYVDEGLDVIATPSAVMTQVAGITERVYISAGDGGNAYTFVT